MIGNADAAARNDRKRKLQAVERDWRGATMRVLLILLIAGACSSEPEARRGLDSPRSPRVRSVGPRGPCDTRLPGWALRGGMPGRDEVESTPRYRPPESSVAMPNVCAPVEGS